MKYIKLFFSLSLILFLLNCSKQTNTPDIGSQTYRVLDSLRTPVAGAKVVLIEFDGQYAKYIRVDSGLTNNSGYVSFNNLIVGKTYLTSTTVGCLTSNLTPTIVIGYFTLGRRDTLEISVWPTGYMHITNPLPNHIAVWSHDFNYNVFNPNSAFTIFLGRKTDTLHWAKFNPTTQSYEGNIFDTVIPISCGDTSNLPLHL